MNKFANVLRAYDALVEKMEKANSMSVRLEAYKEMENFEDGLLDKFVPMIKSHQDYLDALEILEVYPEFAELAEYLTMFFNYYDRYAPEEEPEYVPDVYDGHDRYEDLDDFIDDFAFDEPVLDPFDDFIDDFAFGEPVLDPFFADCGAPSPSRLPFKGNDELERESDAEFYDRQKDLTWKDMEEVLWLESVYR